MAKGLVFTTTLIVGLAVLTALLTVLDRLLARWRLGFLTIFLAGSAFAFLLAAAATELAASADWTFLLALSIAEGLVAFMFIRSALSAGRRWKKPD